MFRLAPTSKFKKEVRRSRKRGKDHSKLKKILEMLEAGRPLPLTMKDHPLRGEFAGCRECHIEGDWLLIYGINREEKVVTLYGTGTHSDLFE